MDEPLMASSPAAGISPGSLLQRTIEAIGPLDEAARVEARARQDTLTKPAGSLGMLEELSIRMAGIQGTSFPSAARKAVFVFAGDHGVVEAGVSAYPSAVTAQMVLNFLHGGAAINVLARQMGARVVVADLGVNAYLPSHPGLIQRKIGSGTRNFTLAPAMSREEAVQAIEAGITIFEEVHLEGVDLAATGDMGIGNTTASSALTAALTGLDPSLVTGRGTGVDEAGWSRKVEAVRKALGLHPHGPDRPLETLAALGGFEISGLVGVVLAAARHRVAVVVDGFISGAAALVAVALAPNCAPYLIAGHQSVECGHKAILAHLGLAPLLNLNLRLGEGTGAVLAMPLVEASCRVLCEMATFAEAGVAGKNG